MKKLLLLAALFYSSSVFAQPSPSPSPVPIDGGVSLLVAAGIGYGAKKIRDARKKRNESEIEKNN